MTRSMNNSKLNFNKIYSMIISTLHRGVKCEVDKNSRVDEFLLKAITNNDMQPRDYREISFRYVNLTASCDFSSSFSSALNLVS